MRRKLLIWFIVIFTILLVIPFFLSRAATVLVLNSPLEKCDAILLYLGDSFRTEKAASLYKKGYASKILFFSVTTDSLKTTPTQMHLASYGIPDSCIIKINRVVQNTAEESHEFISFLKSNPDVKRVIVVSSPYHMLRIRYLLHHFKKKQQVSLEIFFSPAHDTRFNIERWWSNSFSRNIVLKEYLKLGYFMLIDKYNF